jgi:hypothetical protein
MPHNRTIRKTTNGLKPGMRVRVRPSGLMRGWTGVLLAVHRTHVEALAPGGKALSVPVNLVNAVTGQVGRPPSAPQ